MCGMQKTTGGIRSSLEIEVVYVRDTYTVLEIRSKCGIDKCPSIVILGQIISELLRHTYLWRSAHVPQ